jgi:hypothetical protein
MLKLSIDACRHVIALESVAMRIVVIKTLATSIGVTGRFQVCQGAGYWPVESRVALITNCARIDGLCAVRRAEEQKQPEDTPVLRSHLRNTLHRVFAVLPSLIS